jgi:guanylate kinase
MDEKLRASGAKPLLIVISGPSGAGKKTFLDHVASRFPQIKRVTTYTTRFPREGEHDGVDYRFISEDDFNDKVQTGEIFESTRTYGDYQYGSPLDLISTREQAPLVVELDVKGMARLRSSSPRRVVSIFIMPRRLDDLLKRIVARTGETPENLGKRLAAAEMQLDYAWSYDYILVNHELGEFLADVESVIGAELVRQAGIEQMFSRIHS